MSSACFCNIPFKRRKHYAQDGQCTLCSGQTMLYINIRLVPDWLLSKPAGPVLYYYSISHQCYPTSIGRGQALETLAINICIYRHLVTLSDTCRGCGHVEGVVIIGCIPLGAPITPGANTSAPLNTAHPHNTSTIT